MTSAISESSESVERRVTALLQPHFTDLYRVVYDPAFPRADGSTFPWIQVVFAVGPADDAAARIEVHERFVLLLTTVAQLPEVQRADTVSLRARRRVPPQSAPDHPHMFIECAWRGSAVADLHQTHSFSDWHSRCHYYVNRFDSLDPLTRK